MLAGLNNSAPPNHRDEAAQATAAAIRPTPSMGAVVRKAGLPLAVELALAIAESTALDAAAICEGEEELTSPQSSLAMVSSRDCSLELQLLVRMHGPMALTSWLDLLQRHGRSEVVQLMEEADSSRQPKAHCGSWLTRLVRSVEVAVGAEIEDVAFCANVGATKTAAVARMMLLVTFIACGFRLGRNRLAMLVSD